MRMAGPHIALDATGRPGAPALVTHTDTLHLQDPAPGATLEAAAQNCQVSTNATANSAAKTIDSGIGATNVGNATKICFGDGATETGGAGILNLFARLRLNSIPAGATINSASLQFKVRDNGLGDGGLLHPMPVHVSLVAKDGIWDSLAATLAWRSVSAIDGIVTARDGATATLGATGGTAGAVRFGLKEFAGATDLYPTEIGQTVTMTATGTVADCLVRLRKVGAPSGNLRIRIERCTADDGSDDRPNGVALATSANVAASTVSAAATGALSTFTFSGGPTLTSGRRYAFILESDYTADGTNFVQMVVLADNGYASGGLVAHGKPVAFSTASYPGRYQLPYQFKADRTTANVAPFGSVVEVADVVDFTPVGSWLDVADVTTLLQEWVNGGGYAMDDVVAVQVFIGTPLTALRARAASDVRLKITWTA